MMVSGRCREEKGGRKADMIVVSKQVDRGTEKGHWCVYSRPECSGSR